MKAAPLLAALLCTSPALASTWMVDPARSSLSFSGTMQGTPFEGRFQELAAKIEFDPLALDKSSVDVTIPISSITTGSPMRDDELPKPEWFGTEKFPTAHFVASKFTDKGDGSYVADGLLTIRDITLPLSLPFTLETAGNTTHMKGEVQLDRTAFGVGSGEWAGDGTVGKTVTVLVDLVVTKTN